MYSRGSNHDAQPTYKKALLKVFQAPDSPRQRAFKEDPVVFSYSREKSAKNINGAFQEFLGNADPSLFFEKITCMIFLTLSAPTPQNVQTRSNNLSAVFNELLECVCKFCGVGTQKVKSMVV